MCYRIIILRCSREIASSSNRTNASVRKATGSAFNAPTITMLSGIFVILPFIIGNRCRIQTKVDNDTAISMMTHNNYGENSFPSALFITLDPLKLKENKEYEKPSLNQE